MHGGDSLFGRMTTTTHVYRDSGIVDSELDHKAHKVTEKLSESINTIANEPSVAFYRIQEHVRKTLPQLVELKHEVEEVQQLVQGRCFDTEYAGNAVKGMQKSVVHFQNIQELLKNAMFMKQQIDYDEGRKGGSGKEPGEAAAEGENTQLQEGEAERQTLQEQTVTAEIEAAEHGAEATERQTTHEHTETVEREDMVEERKAEERQATQEQTDTRESEDISEQTDEKDIEDRPQGKDAADAEDTQGTDRGEKGDREEGEDATEGNQTQVVKDHGLSTDTTES